MAELGKTQRDWAKHMGFSETTAVAKLSGVVDMKVDELCKTADWLGLDPSFFLVPNGAESSTQANR